MTEWDASGYARVSELQAAMAEEALALLDLRGTERVLDVGCGNGKITAQVADRVPRGSVVGVDSSADMIAFASSHFISTRSNLRFDVADARHLAFRNEFDLIVSFNALHWIPGQEEPLRSMRAAVKSGGLAKLRLVPRGQRKSLENVIEETRLSPRWAGYFHDFHDPYLHLTPEEYAVLAEQSGWRVQNVHVEDKTWDFESRDAFVAFARVTFVEWTRRIAEGERLDFVNDVLDRYRVVAGENAFRFYQMDISLVPR